MSSAQQRYALNRFSVTRQLRYSRDETQLALDLGLFINGLPVATFELKNNLTKQTVEDAVEQYKRDRDPRELLFQFGRCMAHFAVDDQVVRFCTELKGKASWFLPFDQGWNDGAGNPPNPDGLKTDYLWKRILTPDSLTDIIENYAQIVAEKDQKTGKKKLAARSSRATTSSMWCGSCWPTRAAHGAGRRYLIQHSAGSGKSNSIAWLAHQLIGLEQDGKRVFDSIIVVTDRRDPRQADPRHDQAVRPGRLDRRPRRALRRPARGSSRPARRSSSPRSRSSRSSYKEIGDAHRGNTFAIIIDEAHSSQGGQATAADERGARRGRRRGRGRDGRGRDQPDHGVAQDAAQRQLLTPSRPRRRTRRWRSSASPTRPRARSSTGRSTATP